MGFERNTKNQYRRQGQSPKLTLAGRFEGSINGWPVGLVAEGRDLVLTVSHWRTMFTIRRCFHRKTETVRNFLSRHQLRLFVRVRWFGQVRVYPNSSLLIRWISRSGYI
jgi:hypothetical protein